MFGVRRLVEWVSLFGRKVLGLAFYVRLSSLMRTARALSEFRSVSKTAVWRWVVKLKGCLSLSVDVKPRRFVAVDETCVKANGLEYYVFSAVDVDRNEIVCMRVYPSRSMLAAESFFRQVLKLCYGRPEFIVNKAPWLKQALIHLGLVYHHQAFGGRSLAESAFSSLKQRTRAFFNNITVNPKHNEGMRWRRSVECWNLICGMFTYHYNHLGGEP